MDKRTRLCFRVIIMLPFLLPCVIDCPWRCSFLYLMRASKFKINSAFILKCCLRDVTTMRRVFFGVLNLEIFLAIHVHNYS